MNANIMLGPLNLYLDQNAQTAKIFQGIANWRFQDLAEIDISPGAVVIVGYQQILDRQDLIKSLSDQCRIILDFVQEGSLTLVDHIKKLGFNESVRSGKIILLAGGDCPSEYPHLVFDHFLCEIVNYQENHAAKTQSHLIFDRRDKPYDFLFLNGRARPHRKYLYERFKQLGLLDRALWTLLDNRPSRGTGLTLMDQDVNLVRVPGKIKLLPKEYEYGLFHDIPAPTEHPGQSFVKTEIFSGQWGEIFLQPQAYIDTYFSLVTETVFEYPYSFRTEKIAKPIMMGHPWLCVANPGWYRDIRNLGFRTFRGIIDESFDEIDNHQDRIERVVEIVIDLLSQPLSELLIACQDVCKYNQEFLIDFSQKHRQSLPQRLINFLNYNG